MNEDRDAKLWELVYGLLDEVEAAQLRAQICSDRDVARQYARVKLKSELISAAAKAAQCDCEPIGPPQALRIPPARLKTPRGRTLLSTGALALSIALALYTGYAYLEESSPLRPAVALNTFEKLAESHPRLLVVGPSELRLGQSAEYEVMVRSVADDTPLELPIKATLEGRDGQIAWQEQMVTSDGGTQRFQLPPDLHSDAYRLRVAVQSEEENAPAADAAAELSTWLKTTDSASELAWSESVRTAEGEVLQSQVFYDRKYQAAKSASAKKSPQAEQGSVRFGVAHATGPAEVSAASTEVSAGPEQPKLDAVADRDAINSPLPEHLTQGTGVGGEATATSRRLRIPQSVPPLTEEKSPITFDAPAVSATSEALASRQADSEPQIMVEALWDKDGRMKTRLLDRSRRDTEKGSKPASDVAESVASLDSRKALLNYGQAPPQTVEQFALATEATATKEELLVELKFDRPTYDPGDRVAVEVTVTDASGAAVPAILGVEVQAVPAEIADEPFEVSLNPDSASLVMPSTDMPLPLLYDNAAQQHARLEQLSSDYLEQRRVLRQSIASGVLIASAVGFGLLLVSGGFRRSPSPSVWIPCVALLAISSATGVAGFNLEEHVPILPPSPLTAFGIQSEAPSESVSTPTDLLEGTHDNIVEPNPTSDEKLQVLPSVDELAFFAQSAHAAGMAQEREVLSRARSFSGELADIAALSDLERKDASEVARGFEEKQQLSGTLFWQPAIELSNSGQGTFEFIVPEHPVAYRIVVRARQLDKRSAVWRFLPGCVPSSFR